MTDQRPSNWELAGVATEATPLPKGRQHEAAGTTEDCHRQTGACKQQGDLAHANGAVPDDEAARSQLADQPGKSSQREIDPDPSGIGMQFRDDQRRKHRRQRPGRSSRRFVAETSR
jgi:hypothetical protein